MSELLILYRDAQRRYEKYIRYYAIAPFGALIYFDEYSKADQIFVKQALELEAENAALTARIAEMEKQYVIKVNSISQQKESEK